MIPIMVTKNSNFEENSNYVWPEILVHIWIYRLAYSLFLPLIPFYYLLLVHHPAPKIFNFVSEGGGRGGGRRRSCKKRKR